MLGARDAGRRRLQAPGVKSGPRTRRSEFPRRSATAGQSMAMQRKKDAWARGECACEVWDISFLSRTIVRIGGGARAKGESSHEGRRLGGGRWAPGGCHGATMRRPECRQGRGRVGPRPAHTCRGTPRHDEAGILGACSPEPQLEPVLMSMSITVNRRTFLKAGALGARSRQPSCRRSARRSASAAG